MGRLTSVGANEVGKKRGSGMAAVTTRTCMRGLIGLFFAMALTSCHPNAGDRFPNGAGGLTARVVDGQIRIEEFDCSERYVSFEISFYDERTPADLREEEDRIATFDLQRTTGDFDLTLDDEFFESPLLTTDNSQALSDLISLNPKSKAMAILSGEIEGTPRIQLLWIDVAQLKALADGQLAMYDDGFERPIADMCGTKTDGTVG